MAAQVPQYLKTHVQSLHMPVPTHTYIIWQMLIAMAQIECGAIVEQSRSRDCSTIAPPPTYIHALVMLLIIFPTRKTRASHQNVYRQDYKVLKAENSIAISHLSICINSTSHYLMHSNGLEVCLILGCLVTHQHEIEGPQKDNQQSCSRVGCTANGGTVYHRSYISSHRTHVGQHSLGHLHTTCVHADAQAQHTLHFLTYAHTLSHYTPIPTPTPTPHLHTRTHEHTVTYTRTITTESPSTGARKGDIVISK